MKQRISVWAFAGVAGLIAALAIAGCGATHRLPSSGAAASSQQALQVMRELSRCIRAHGVPAFPDPQTGNDGLVTFPDSAPRVPAGAQQACAPIANRLPARYTSTQPVSTVDFGKLLQFARCIRAHGVPDWPDPNPLGEFPVDQRIFAGGKRLLRSATQSCARINPNPAGGIKVVRAP